LLHEENPIITAKATDKNKNDLFFMMVDLF